MPKTAEQILESLEKVDWKPELVQVFFEDEDGRHSGRTLPYSYDYGLMVLAAMKKVHPTRLFWLEEVDND